MCAFANISWICSKSYGIFPWAWSVFVPWNLVWVWIGGLVRWIWRWRHTRDLPPTCACNWSALPAAAQVAGQKETRTDLGAARGAQGSRRWRCCVALACSRHLLLVWTCSSPKQVTWSLWVRVLFWKGGNKVKVINVWSEIFRTEWCKL